MGKSLDDLPLSDQPLPQPQDVRETAWFRFCQEIDDLILSDDYAWALDAAARRHRMEGGRRSRRYEGFSR